MYAKVALNLKLFSRKGEIQFKIFYIVLDVYKMELNSNWTKFSSFKLLLQTFKSYPLDLHSVQYKYSRNCKEL